MTRAAAEADRQERMAYRNTLPQGVQALTALLDDTSSPWHREVIQAYLEVRRAHNRRRRDLQKQSRAASHA